MAVPTATPIANKGISRHSPMNPDFIPHSPPMSPSAPFATAVPLGEPATPSSSFDSAEEFAVGDQVRFTGLKAAHMNGVLAVIEKDIPMPGGRIQVRLLERDEGKIMCIKPENLIKQQVFTVGQLVMLDGLSKKEMNGLEAMVEAPAVEGRVRVRLYEGKSFSIKVENLQVVADVLD